MSASRINWVEIVAFADALSEWTSPSPSPRPSPAGRGSHAVRVLPTGTPQHCERGLTFPLSQRERAGVRENGLSKQTRLPFLHTSAPFSLAPGFSRVLATAARTNRFNGLFVFPRETVETVLASLPVTDTRLKPGANKISTFGACLVYPCHPRHLRAASSPP